VPADRAAESIAVFPASAADSSTAGGGRGPRVIAVGAGSPDVEPRIGECRDLGGDMADERLAADRCRQSRIDVGAVGVQRGEDGAPSWAFQASRYAWTTSVAGRVDTAVMAASLAARATAPLSEIVVVLDGLGLLAAMRAPSARRARESDPRPGLAFAGAGDDQGM
jgi:hypothetical protein